MADLKVLTRNADGSLRVGLVRPPVKISGMDLLAQLVTMEFLRNPGRNIQDTTAGAGFRSLIGSNVDDEAEFFTDLRIMVSNAEKNIRERQVNTTRTSEERLAHLNLIDIIAIESPSNLEIVVEIVSEAEEVRRQNVRIR